MKKFLYLFIVLASLNAQSLAMNGAGGAGGAGAHTPPAGGPTPTVGSGANDVAFYGTVVLGTGGFLCLGEWVAQSDGTYRLSKKINVSQKDMGRMIFLCHVMWQILG